MFVLKILGILFAAVVIYGVIESINNSSYRRFRYEIFNMQNYIITTIAYAFIFFGFNNYKTAFSHGGDTLNGILVVIIGIFLVIFVVYTNIKNTNFRYGLLMSIFQLVLYTILAVVGFIVALLALAFFAQTKPVYVINQD